MGCIKNANIVMKPNSLKILKNTQNETQCDLYSSWWWQGNPAVSINLYSFETRGAYRRKIQVGGYSDFQLPEFGI